MKRFDSVCVVFVREHLSIFLLRGKLFGVVFGGVHMEPLHMCLFCIVTPEDNLHSVTEYSVSHSACASFVILGIFDKGYSFPI